MNKALIALFFSFIFLSLITVPTIVVVLDDTIDISFVYNISEEEENKEFEKFVVELDSECEGFIDSNNIEFLQYKFKTYQKPHLNLISPPPEFIL